MRIRDIVIVGMLAALLLIVQVGLRLLPNIELVSLLIILYTLILRRKTIYIILIFILSEGLLYGFGLWWINYLYIWYVLYFITMVFRKSTSNISWALISGVYGLAFGALCSIPYLFIGSNDKSILGGLHMAFSYWISGIPYDIPHGVGNFILALLLFKPLYKLLSRLAKMYYNNSIELS